MVCDLIVGSCRLGFGWVSMANAHIGHALRALAVTRATSPATVCDGRVKTGRELLERIAALSWGLRQRGLKPGDRVAIAAWNSDFYLEWLLAVPCAGGIMTPLNYRWSVQEACEAVQKIQPTFVVVDRHCVGWCSELKLGDPDLQIVMIGEGPDDGQLFLHAESIIQLAGRQGLQLCWAPNSIALICFTSGTTGRPKGVMLTHSALVIQSLAKIAMVNYSCNDVYLHTTPLCHIGGISSAHAMVMAQGCHIFLPKFQVPTVVEAIKNHQVTAMICVPTMLNNLVSFMLPKGEDQPLQVFSSMKTILNGGGNLSFELLERAIDLFPISRFLSAYGMTEACSSMSFVVIHDPQLRSCFLEDNKSGTKLNLLERKNGANISCHLGGCCVGKPAPHVEILIGMPSYFSCRSSLLFKEGKVLVRGPHMMSGYWGQPKETEAAFDEEGWFDTGDIGWMDEKGRLWLLGRKKDVIKTGGLNVYPIEIENILSRHPAVLAAAVVGVKDAWLDEAVSAMVLIRSGWRWEDESCHGKISDSSEISQAAHEEKAVSPSLLRSYCGRQGLSRYKVPRIIVRRTTPFPVTSTGKFRKDLVAEEISMNHRSQLAFSLRSKL